MADAEFMDFLLDQLSPISGLRSKKCLVNIACFLIIKLSLLSAKIIAFLSKLIRKPCRYS